MAWHDHFTDRLAYVRERLDTSVWLIPIALCLLSALLAVIMLWTDRLLQAGAADWRPFVLDLDSARQVLGIIAGSIIGVGGVAFSVTMVALTLTSGQYGPKILRNFLEDNPSKISLGLFLGTYVYALIVLSGYSAEDTPRASVWIALLLAFLTLAGFVQFIHRSATDLQADQIIFRIGRQLQRALLRQAEDAGGGRRSFDTSGWRAAARSLRPYPVASNRRGYVQSVNYAGLVRWCVANRSVLQVRVRAGDFIVERGCLFKLYRRDVSDLDGVLEALNAHVLVGPMRTPVQDTEYAITQLNQLVARALSPGINDPGTAMTCVDWFSLALAEVIDRDLPGCVFLDDEHQPRLLARVGDFNGIVKAIYAPLRQLSGNDVGVTIRLLESLCRLGELTARPDRLEILRAHGGLIHDVAHTRRLTPADLIDVRRRYRQLLALTRPRTPPDQATEQTA